ncbi:MAG: T9SS type A sorting domain-containing protein [Chitinophagaceae bacterium]|nr:T9SS type A sorting domain-containing protein [Chitinophagaceae bacterium]
MAGLVLLLTGVQTIAQVNPVTDSNADRSGIAAVGDYVWLDQNKNGIQDADESGVPNVMVILYDSALRNIAAQYTDSKGRYRFENIAIPASGSKYFRVGFYNIPPNHAYAMDLKNDGSKEISSKADPITGRTKLFQLQAGSERTDLDAGIIPSPGIVLPLTIDQFNGFYDNGVIQLKWTTFTEINIDHFDIERSTDGTNFRQIGRVYASGNADATTAYSYIDVSAERGTNFYRLAMIDNDGNYTYSKAVTLTVDLKGITVSVVYPNPFSKKVQVKLDCLKPEQITIRVINSSGVVVRTQMADLQKGENNIVVQQVAELPGGMYFLEVIGDHRSMKTKLMKE